MSNGLSSATGATDPHEVLLIELISDERVSVAVAETRFEAALDKSDKLEDDDSSARDTRSMDKVSVEEARLLLSMHVCAFAYQPMRYWFRCIACLQVSQPELDGDAFPKIAVF